MKKLANIRLVIFDFDGTLLNTDRRYVAAYAKVLRMSGFKPPEGSRILRMRRRGFSGVRIIETVTGSNDADLVAKCDSLRRKLLGSGFAADAPIPGVKGMLKKLRRRKIRIALVTSRKNGTVQRQLRSLGMTGYFDMVFAVHSDNPVELKRRLFSKAMETAGASAAETLVVGDTECEIIAGRKLGAHSAGVLTGYSSASLLRKSRPEAVLKSAADVAEMLG
jgi:phosphoglycolate phosphatase-like HAD superfamily hydrolase